MKLYEGFLDTTHIAYYHTQCKQELISLQHIAQQCTDDRYAFLWLPAAYTEHTSQQAIITAVRAYQPHIIVLAGIGGSAMGTLAVYHALSHLLPQEAPQLWCADTIDPITSHKVAAEVHAACQAGKRVALFIISKSGSTVETMANAALYYNILHAHGPLHPNQIVVITDQGSALWHHAQTEKLLCATVPTHLGGRFSVWSAATTIPLAVIGIPVSRLLAGATQATEQMLQQTTPAITLAASRMAAYRHGLPVHDTFVSAPHLVRYGDWYRQLMAESLGKTASNETNGTLARFGIIPTTSVLAQDLHSLFQLYMAGPRSIMTTFVRDAYTPAITMPIPCTPFSYTQELSNQTTATLASSLYTATTTAYRDAGLPYMEIDIDSSDSATLGKLLQQELIATILLGRLLNLNPFDQPDVARYKKILSQMSLL